MSDGREEREEREKRIEQERRDIYRERDTTPGFDPLSDRLDPYPADPWEPERRDS